MLFFFQNAFTQVNNVAHDEEIASAMISFATTAAADRTTVKTRTATVQSLTTELATVNAQLVTSLAKNSTLTATITSTGKRRPRGRGGGEGRGHGRGGANDPAFYNRLGGPT